MVIVIGCETVEDLISDELNKDDREAPNRKTDKKMTVKEVWTVVFWNLGIFALLGVIYLIFNLITGEGCPIYWLTSIRCPFCGMTRAHLAALRFDFETAFAYHPLFPLGLPYIFLLANDGLFQGKWKVAYGIVVGILTAIFVVRYGISLF